MKTARALSGQGSSSTSPKADRSAIADFLELMAMPSIHLVAIVPEGQLQGRWFGERLDEAVNWAAGLNDRGNNIYWTVNSVRPGLHGKPKKTDITNVRYLYVDIDPRGDVPFDKASRILDLELCNCDPSFIVDSGGGLQAFWKLRRGVSTAEAEQINKLLADELEGDDCWNIDRLMRVAGTVNHPNKKKRAAGRVAAMARLVTKQPAKEYSSDEIRQSLLPRAAPPPTQLQPPQGNAHPPLSDRLKRLITEPRGVDRSADTFAAACEMVRCGYSDKQIVDVLLDPTNPISEHCLEQADAERAARRAAERARKSLNVVPAAIDREDRSSISAHLFSWPEASEIPPRPWLYGTQLQRGLLSLLIAPGGTGKTAYTVGMALALASGRDLLATKTARPLTVWLYNLEDPLDELNRAITAGRIAHELSPEQFADRLFVNSGVDHSALCTAVQTRDGVQMSDDLIDHLAEELREKKIDVFILDPFVSTHQVNENDNGAIDAVVKAWARVAFLANCAILLVHHTPKNLPNITADAARGASSLVNAARSVTTLNRMTSEEARKYGIEPEQARRFVKAYDDKNNRAPPADASHWYELASVRLPNGTSDQEGDSVGVVVPWIPPTVQAERDLDPETLRKIARALEDPRREHEQSPDWAGFAIASALDVKVDIPAQKQMLKALIRGAVRAGAIEIFEAQDVRRKSVRWLRAVPTWLENDAESRDLDAVRGGAESRSGAAPGRAAAPGAPPPLRGGEPGAEQGEHTHG